MYTPTLRCNFKEQLYFKELFLNLYYVECEFAPVLLYFGVMLLKRKSTIYVNIFAYYQEIFFENLKIEHNILWTYMLTLPFQPNTLQQ